MIKLFIGNINLKVTISVFVMQVFAVPGYRDDQDGKKNVATTGK
jgi:hypothetical protein